MIDSDRHASVKYAAWRLAFSIQIKPALYLQDMGVILSDLPTEVLPLWSGARGSGAP